MACSALALAALAAAGHSTRAAASGAPVALFHRAAVAYGGETFPNVAQDAQERSLWIAQGYHANLIPQYAAANPSIKSFLYKESIFTDSHTTQSATDQGNASGVDYAQASAHPRWFLLDANGNRITNSGFAPYYLMDIGNRNYQNTWAANAITQAKRDGWSGVFADDLGLALYNTRVMPVKYPTPAAWQGAVQSFIKRVGLQLHAAGLLLITNTCGGVTYPTVRSSWLQYVDGMMEEGWMRPTTDHNQALANAAGSWKTQLDELADAEAQGKYYLAEMPADTSDVAGIRYGLATFLLAANGTGSYDVSGTQSYANPIWQSPDFDNARALGSPTGSYTVANGVYSRSFANGVVLVNPSSSTQTVSLGGSYSGSGLTDVSSVTLAPSTGVVLDNA
jgi:hypothetical protein